MRKLFSGTIGSVLFFAIVGCAVYFGNVELQSYWGRQAVADTGLEIHRLEDALAKAKSENKLVFVDVSAIWCGTCRRLDNEVFSNEEVKKVLNERFVFSRLEYEEEEGQKFIRERNVEGFPNLWVLDSDGNNIKRLRVMFDPKKFADQLKVF
ncbi:MAG: thioredoxin family protein [Pyrinomonadaceae bacterium]|nr:thioredoxin family protein [Pyrinomonadaceae bacterium]